MLVDILFCETIEVVFGSFQPQVALQHPILKANARKCKPEDEGPASASGGAMGGTVLSERWCS